MNKKFILCIVLVVSLIIFNDVIIAHVLSAYICNIEIGEAIEIHAEIDVPGSVYWRDDLYPGFAKSERIRMIKNYLDGENLTKLILNDDKGNLYKYEATLQDWGIYTTDEDSHFLMSKIPNINDAARKIESKGVIIENEDVDVNYTVASRNYPLEGIQNKYLWADIIEIINNSTGAVVAKNTRVLHRWYSFLPDISIGKRYYIPEAECGYYATYLFDTEVMFKYWRKFVPAKHGLNLNHHLYNKETEND